MIHRQALGYIKDNLWINIDSTCADPFRTLTLKISNSKNLHRRLKINKSSGSSLENLVL